MKTTPLIELPSSGGIRIPKSIQHVKENLQKPEEVKSTAADPAEEIISGGSNQSFTPEQLQAAWNAFAEKLDKKAFSNEYMVIHNKKLELTPDYTIHFSVAHDVQLDQLENIKVDLLAYLRTTLKNRAIKLNAITSFVATGEKKMFTDEDKFRHLSENYPLVNDLRKKFGLEINY